MNIKCNLELKRGNLKIGKDTIIFNMGSATECPSKKKGKCKLGNKCYALKDEMSYPDCKPYRDRQKSYWLNSGIGQIITDFHYRISRMRIKPKYFRFNEAGDFWSQDCVDKLNKISSFLLSVFGIKTYGFSVRDDLDFSKVSFSVKGSGHDKGNNGKTIVKDKRQIKDNQYVQNNEVFELCPMDCRTCSMCKDFNNLNVVFPLLQ
jgi:hypothetical protein